MTESSRSASFVPEQGAYIVGTFEGIRRCPARSDYIELCFSTESGPWRWCCSELQDDESTVELAPLAIVQGRYGVQARLVVDGEIGLSVPSSEAIVMILGGCRTAISRRLVESGH